MNKIRFFLNQLNKNNKLQIIVCLVLCSFVVFGFFIVDKIIEKKAYYKYEIIDDYNVVTSIEKLDINNNNLLIDGYAFILNNKSPNTSISLFLRNVINGKEIWADIEEKIRPDIGSYFSDEYKSSGFQASFSMDSKIKSNQCYEIIINIDSIDNNNKRNRKTVSTKKYFFDGKLYNYNPNTFDNPILDLESELLYKVFTEGQLCYYQKDAGMYIYKYLDNIYWIANKDFMFSQNGKTSIPYHINTTQKNKLPTHRIKNGFDNLDFYFEEFEYRSETTSPYRVAIRNIPDDYPIANIRTGHYDTVNKTWYWSLIFSFDNRS